MEDIDMKKFSLLILNIVSKCQNDTTVLKAWPNAWFYDSQKKPLVNDYTWTFFFHYSCQ